MGTNKALLPLAGKPLIQHATTKLARLCASVKILSSDSALASYAPLVGDLHPDCGPLSGIEAALLNSASDWNLILPVDVPFLPTEYLDRWLWAALHGRTGPLRIAMLAVDATPQPTLLIVHRQVAGSLTESLEAGHHKLFPALRKASLALAAQARVTPAKVFWESQYDDFWAPRWKGEPATWREWDHSSGPEDIFMNVNTPEDFAAAERFAGALDT